VSQGDREGEEKGLGARRKWMGTRDAWLLKRAVSVMGFLPPLQCFSFKNKGVSRIQSTEK
jgi:hypothetical protein